MLRCEEVFAGIECWLKESKLLLDCVLIVTSVVPLELLMELPLSVNLSLVALYKFGVYPARVCQRLGRAPDRAPPQLSSALRGPSPVAGRRGRGGRGVSSACTCPVAGGVSSHLTSPSAQPRGQAAARGREGDRARNDPVPRRGALVLLDDGTIVGDSMEKMTLEALDWVMSKVRRARGCCCAVLGVRCWLTRADGRGPGRAGEDDGAAPHAAARAVPVSVLVGAEAHLEWQACRARRAHHASSAHAARATSCPR